MSETFEEMDAVPRTKNWPWYVTPVGDRLTPAARELFEKYSGIPADEIEEHVTKCASLQLHNTFPSIQPKAPSNRDMAWEVFPFPCIGEWWFLSFGIAAHPFYAEVLNSLTADDSKRFLDLGCCFGQDLRKLSYDGAPVETLYGSDLLPGYERCGYELFRDEDRFRDHFIAADIFDESESAPLVQTQGTWDVISVFMFLHVFDLEQGGRACRRILKLLKPDKGASVVGTQTGALTGGTFPMLPPFVAKVGDRTTYQHSKETFVEMWKNAARQEEIELNILANYQDVDVSKNDGVEKKTYFSGDGRRKIHFRIERI